MEKTSNEDVTQIKETAYNDEVPRIVDFTEEEGRKIKRIMDTRLMAILLALQIVFYIDKSNIGNAHTAGMADDLPLTANQYNIVVVVFYVIYTVSQPLLLMWRIVPIHIWAAFCAFGWGCASTFQAFAVNFGALLTARIFLAMFESAMASGISLYISLMWSRVEYGFRWALFQCTAALGVAFASSLAYGITQAHTALHPWRLLLLIEGCPTFIVALVLFIWLPDSPDKCRWWKNDHQRNVAYSRVASGGLDTKESLSWDSLLASALDPWTYLSSTLHFCGSATFNSIAVFLSAIVKEMGYTSINAQGLSAPVFIVGFIIGVVVNYISDRYKVRGPFICVGSSFGAIGYFMLCFTSSTGARYAATYILAAGVYTSQPLMFAWASNNVATKNKRATTMTIFGIAGQCGGILGTNMYKYKDDFYFRGNIVCAAISCLAVLLSVVIMLYFSYLNKAKDRKYGPPSNDRIIDVTKDGESNPNWRYML